MESLEEGIALAIRNLEKGGGIFQSPDNALPLSLWFCLLSQGHLLVTISNELDREDQTKLQQIVNRYTASHCGALTLTHETQPDDVFAFFSALPSSRPPGAPDAMSAPPGSAIGGQAQGAFNPMLAQQQLMMMQGFNPMLMGMHMMAQNDSASARPISPSVGQPAQQQQQTAGGGFLGNFVDHLKKLNPMDGVRRLRGTIHQNRTVADSNREPASPTNVGGAVGGVVQPMRGAGGPMGMMGMMGQQNPMFMMNMMQFDPTAAQQMFGGPMGMPGMMGPMGGMGMGMGLGMGMNPMGMGMGGFGPLMGGAGLPVGPPSGGGQAVATWPLYVVYNLDSANQKTLAAIMEIMASKQVTVDGQLYNMPPNFTVIATTSERSCEPSMAAEDDQDGESSNGDVADDDSWLVSHLMDQFLLNFRLRHHKYFSDPLDDSKASMPPFPLHEVEQARHRLSRVHSGFEVQQYVRDVVVTCRAACSAVDPSPSPLAADAILAAAKVVAHLWKQDFLTPNQVALIAPHVLSHRLRVPVDLLADVFQQHHSTPVDLLILFIDSCIKRIHPPV